MPLRKSLRWKAASASRRSAAAGLRHLAGFGLDLGFELDRRVGEIIALEGLVGGDGWERTTAGRARLQRQRERTRAWGTSIPVGRGDPNGVMQDERQKHVEVVAEFRRRAAAATAARPDDSPKY